MKPTEQTETSEEHKGQGMDYHSKKQISNLGGPQRGGAPLVISDTSHIKAWMVFFFLHLVKDWLVVKFSAQKMGI